MDTRIVLLFYNILLVTGQDEILLTKCCPDNFHVKNTCVINTIANNNFTDVPVYDVDEDNSSFQLKQQFHSLFRVVANSLISPGKEITNAQLFFSGFIITSDEFRDTSTFCLDYKEIGNTTEIGFWSLSNDTEPQLKSVKNQLHSYISIAALLTSCVFLSLTILVYMLLPDLRNTKGKIILSCVVSFLGAFLGLATMYIVAISRITLPPSFCYIFTSIFYFFILSSFCWMNVYSFILWQDFRRLFDRMQRNKREIENRRYRKCLVYGWGVPMILTILLNVFDHTGLDRFSWFMTPNIIQNGCFLRGYERLLYLDLPMLLLLIGNCYFFIITAFNILGTFKDTRALSESALTLKNLLLLYVKLSVLMGISWVLEIITHLLPPSQLNPFWLVVDLYNGFIGVAFFMVLVCKKQIWRSLRLRWKKKDANTNNIYSTRSRSTKLQSVRSDNSIP